MKTRIPNSTPIREMNMADEPCDQFLMLREKCEWLETELAALEIVYLSSLKEQPYLRGAHGERRIKPSVIAEMERRKAEAITIFRPRGYVFRTNMKTSKQGGDGVDYEFHRVENCSLSPSMC